MKNIDVNHYKQLPKQDEVLFTPGFSKQFDKIKKLIPIDHIGGLCYERGLNDSYPYTDVCFPLTPKLKGPELLSSNYLSKLAKYYEMDDVELNGLRQFGRKWKEEFRPVSDLVMVLPDKTHKEAKPDFYLGLDHGRNTVNSVVAINYISKYFEYFFHVSLVSDFPDVYQKLDARIREIYLNKGRVQFFKAQMLQGRPIVRLLVYFGNHHISLDKLNYVLGSWGYKPQVPCEELFQKYFYICMFMIEIGPPNHNFLALEMIPHPGVEPEKCYRYLEKHGLATHKMIKSLSKFDNWDFLKETDDTNKFLEEKNHHIFHVKLTFVEDKIIRSKVYFGYQFMPFSEMY